MSETTITAAAVKGFLGQERIALVGASASGKGFGVTAMRELKKKGYQVVPIHPTAETIEGEPAFASIRDLPHPVGAALLVVPPEQTEAVIEEVIEAGVGHVWMQQGAESARAVSRCEEAGVQIVAGECVLMFANGGAFPHNLHRLIWKILGKLPEDEPVARDAQLG